MNKKQDTAILLLVCPDQKGILAAVTEFINENKGNIIYLDQHVDIAEKAFFMRVEWEINEFLIPKEKISDYFHTLFAQKFRMDWEIYFSDKIPRMALFVSKSSHCLYDILSRYANNEWNIQIPLIISNHTDLEKVAHQFGVYFHHLSITQENKTKQEKEEMELLEKYNIDFIVLARYMQIITDRILTKYSGQIINIHHSFLPAFVGAKPYHAAHERGVKIIGATSHYVTEKLDAGPIIDQDVVRISHKDNVKRLIEKGRDLEKIVLARAVNKHIQHKILTFKNRTIVFD